MIKLFRSRNASDEKAVQTFREFTWALAAMLHHNKYGSKTRNPVKKKTKGSTSSTTAKTDVLHQC